MRLFSAKPPAERYAEGQLIDVGGFVVRLKVSRRARRVSLRIDAVSGTAIATAPSERRLGEAAAFAGARRAWIANRLASAPVAWPLFADEPLALFGLSHRLAPDGRRPRLTAGADGPVIAGCGVGAVDGQLVARAVKAAAVRWFGERVDRHCRHLGVAPPALAVGDARTRWGSCAPARRGGAARIRLSWRLALAPFAVADYVVAHECAHLIEANHGPAFWRLVHDLVGEASLHRAWLRAHGARLHAFGRTPRATLSGAQAVGVGVGG